MTFWLPIKQLFLLATMWLIFGKANAQNDSIKSKQLKQLVDTTIVFKNNAVYGELLGNIGAYSLNYEKKIYEHKYGFFTARIGFFINQRAFAVGPILINHVFLKEKHHFEIGGGVGLVAGIHKNSLTNKLEIVGGKEDFVPTANLMYRYQKPSGRFIFRIGWTPSFYPKPFDEIATVVRLVYFGISAGYVF